MTHKQKVAASEKHWREQVATFETQQKIRVLGAASRVGSAIIHKHHSHAMPQAAEYMTDMERCALINRLIGK